MFKLPSLFLFLLLALPCFSVEEAPPVVETPPVEVVPAPGIIEILRIIGEAPSFTPEEVVEGCHRINPGAEVPIYAIEDPLMFTFFSRLPSEAAGHVIGLFRWNPKGEAAPTIYIQGVWTREIMVSIHEYQHYLEYMMPNCRVELREAFLKLSSEQFSFCAGDLRGPAEPNTEAPKLNPFPVTDDSTIVPPEFQDVIVELE